MSKTVRSRAGGLTGGNTECPALPPGRTTQTIKKGDLIMPNSREVASITVGGATIKNFKQLRCTAKFNTAWREFSFVKSETSGEHRIGPGDSTNISLGGRQFLRGAVNERIAALGAANHDVAIA